MNIDLLRLVARLVTRVAWYDIVLNEARILVYNNVAYNTQILLNSMIYLLNGGDLYKRKAIK